MKELDYEELDPDIRETVRRLNDWGFETTDSGDGHTKFENLDLETGDLHEIPHVYMVVDPAELVSEARRLTKLVQAQGIEVSEAWRSDIWIESFYDPANDIAVIGLFGVTDDTWPEGDLPS